MADPLQNAAFVQSLFRPVTDTIAGYGEAGVKAATMGYQDRLRQIKRQQELRDQATQFGYHRDLVNLQIAGQKDIALEQTKRTLEAQDKQTERAYELEKERTDRAVELATAKELADAKKQYRLLAGGAAKEISSFGKTPGEQLDGLNLELAKLNDAKARSAARIYLNTQKSLNDEMQRITTVTDKDEAQLVANALNSITSKDAREKLAKLKGITNAASILTFLAPLYPSAAAEFSAGYEGAKDAIINSRSKSSKIQTLQQDLQYKAALLKDPAVMNYIATGLGDDLPALPANQTKAPLTLDDMFGARPKVSTKADNPGAVPVPVSRPRMAPPELAPVPAYTPFQTPQAGAANSVSDFVRDNLFVRPFQALTNGPMRPSNWDTSKTMANGDPAWVYSPPAESVVPDLLTRLNYVNDRGSPRATDIRNQLYDLTSPAAYINSRPNYFTGGR